MITCDRCQTENLEGSQYCDECGAALGSGESQQARKPAADDGGGDPDNASHAKVVERRAAEGDATSGKPDSQNGHHVETHVPAPTAAPGGQPAHFAAHSSQDVSQRGQDGPHAKLVIHRGRAAGKEFPLNEDESQIGRWDADGGVFPDVDLDADDSEAKVSRRHARITRRGDQYYIEDLGSTNGTFINRGRRLLPGDRQLLHDGDEVIVGKTFLRFHILK
ncbi:MAG: FHA domain-containing protein [Acidobacteria bacterium]|nr:FHA domain-containing protein [Acidobacteriota bacterium]